VNKEMRDRARAEGKCTYCGKARPKTGKLRCAACCAITAKAAKRYHRRKAKASGKAKPERHGGQRRGAGRPRKVTYLDVAGDHTCDRCGRVWA
jgi:hypothetical protein